MNEQQQGGGFSGSKNTRRFDGGGSGRPNFGGRDFSRGGGRESGQTQLFRATCSNCGKPCEVPFRPSGERAVYCKECFAKRRESSPREFQKQRGAPQFSSSSSQQSGGVRLDELKRQLDTLNTKLDMVLQRIGAGSGTVSPAKKEKATAATKRVARKPRAASKSSKK